MKRQIIEIDEMKCNGCGQCATACAEGAIKMINGKAKLISDSYCDGLGACLGTCPMDAITMIEREAPAFDEVAVKAALDGKNTHLSRNQAHAHGSAGFVCPSAAMKQFTPRSTDSNDTSKHEESSPSRLGHWPVQIRLIPPHAPFLQNADLLILADCAAVAYPALQREFVDGRVVMMGCPKFDDTDLYHERFLEIFSNVPIRSITILKMEVPCCSGLSYIVEQALVESKAVIPLKKITVSLQGEVVNR